MIDSVETESTKEQISSILETEKGIKLIKDFFNNALSQKLDLIRVSAPLYVEAESGLNDDLNGVERSICFDFKSGQKAKIVHSLAKWKRVALTKYGIENGKGLYTDMNAIRRDEDLTPLHSYYVDQWDWELIIKKEERTMDKLKEIVNKIYECVKDLEEHINKTFPKIEKKLPETITFISTQELEDQYPDSTPKEREYKCSKQYGAVFITQVGKVLKSGQKHDGRAPDYDDWELNGDIILYYPQLDIPFELSSMGIRVDEERLLIQLKESGNEDRLQLPFHKNLLAGKYHYTVGGGIGQSRLCMFLLNKRHIGEVQVSIWDKATIEFCHQNNIELL